jgi:hypothetical protein
MKWCGSFRQQSKSIYPSAEGDCDEEILLVWKMFLEGELRSWKELVKDGITEGRPPSVYFHDVFKEMLHKNLRTQCPKIAKELDSRPFKCTARIFVSMLEFLLDNALTRQGDHSSHDESLDEKERSKRRAEKNQYITKIAKHHIKWNVDDASYITVENAIMESLRVCLGADFTAAFEVRMRYKYGQVKQLLQNRARNFQQMHPDQTATLRAVGKMRMDELDRVMALRADIRQPRASRINEAKDYATRKEERDSNAMRACRWTGSIE